MGLFDKIAKKQEVIPPVDRIAAAKEGIRVAAAELEAKAIWQPYDINPDTPPGVKLLRLAQENKPMDDYAKSLFLEALAEIPNEHRAALKAGVTILEARRQKKIDPAFETAWEMAKNLAVGYAEEEAFRRAVEGVERKKFSGNELINVEREYSDTLMVKILQANEPRYEPKSNIKAEVSANLNWFELIQAMSDAKEGK